MSKVEELLAKYNSNGISTIKLADILDYEQPSKYIVSSSEYDDNYDIPVLTAGQSFILGYTDEKDGVYKASKNNPTIIFDDFTTGHHWVDFDFKIKSSAMKMLRLKNNKSLLRYIFHSMALINYVPTEHSRQWISKYSQFEIPLPHIKVQEEIVKILDSFTNLIDALNEELSLRQKQFEYYREKLLTFDETVERLSFGNDFSLKARIGWQGLTKKEYRKSGDYYLITGTDFKGGNKIDFSTCVYVDEERYTQDPNIQIKPNDVLITKDGTLGKVAFIEKMDKPATLNGGVFVVRSKVGGVIPKYVAYYLSSPIFKNWIEQNHTNGSIMHLTQKLLVKFEIAIPSTDVQQSIVKKLDAFESLISSLKEEIALRQKQYEYYREKLLTFD